LKDRKIIVCRPTKHEYFTAPGGRIEKNETPKQALIRELKEELNIKVNQDELEMFGTFSATAVAENDKVIKMVVYIVKRWKGEISPKNEIKEIAWINSKHPENMKVGSIFEHKVIPRLKRLNLID